jgi:spore coat polysaccharide biosynthesis protein SpsF (cytidylyltransferase family)
MSSTRLPGKSLMDLGGITLVESVYRGASTAREVDKVVVSIPLSSSDDVLDDFLCSKGIPVSRGLEDNLILRHLQVAEEEESEILVRIPGDNPLPHGEEIDRVVNFHLNHNLNGFTTNLSQILCSGYPDGIGAEVFSTNSLRAANSLSPSEKQKEHVHLNFVNYETSQSMSPEFFQVKAPTCPPQFARPDVILDINDEGDLRYFRAMFRDLGTNNPQILEIIDWHDMIGSKIKATGRAN